MTIKNLPIYSASEISRERDTLIVKFLIGIADGSPGSEAIFSFINTALHTPFASLLTKMESPLFSPLVISLLKLTHNVKPLDY